MDSGPRKLAQLRLANALLLFEAFVRQTARHADAATLRGLERRFAEQVDVQPSYWSQIKGGTRQIGERLARQFEQRCDQPRGWLDLPHSAGSLEVESPDASNHSDELAPCDEDERFIVGLVLTYYRRHPQRARTRLLGLLGEVLVPTTSASPARGSGEASKLSGANLTDDAHALWQRSQSGVAPLKRRK